MEFKKEVLESLKISNNETLYKCNLYTILVSNNTVAQFVINKKTGYFKFNERQIKIEIKKHFLKSIEFNLFENNEQIGTYYFPTWKLNYREIGYLIINNEKLLLKKLQPIIKSHIFKRETWGYYRYCLSNQIDEVIYEFRIEPKKYGIYDREYSNSCGTISNSNLPLDIVVYGLLLIEKALHDEDYET